MSRDKIPDGDAQVYKQRLLDLRHGTDLLDFVGTGYDFLDELTEEQVTALSAAVDS